MKYFRSISIYAFVSFFGAGINFFLMPYLSHFISPAEYGILALINSFVTILIPITGLVASGLIAVEYYKTQDKDEFASLFSSIQVVPLIPTMLWLVVTVVFSRSLANFLEIPPNKSYWLVISALLAAFTIYYETLLSYNVIEKQPGYYALFNVSRILIEVGLTIWFVSGLKMSWEGRLLSWLISSLMMFAISIFYFRKRGLFTKRISWKYMNASIVFGLPLILHTIGKFVINQSDRIFIAKMVSLKEAGIYNIGYQVGMVILLFVNAIGNFYQPFLYERLANLTDKARIEIIRMSYLLILGLLICLLLITFFSPLFFDWLVSRNYAEGVTYVFWIGLSYFFWGVYILFSGFIFYIQKTRFLGVLAVINVLLNLVLNYFFIGWLGALGAAYATCVSYFVIAIAVIIEVSKHYPLPWLNLKLILSRSEKIIV